MNICVVSTFDGTTDDYMEMFNVTKEKAADFFGDYYRPFNILCLV